MNVLSDSKQHANFRLQLQHQLAEFMKIKQTGSSYTIVSFETDGNNFENAQDKSRKAKTSAE